MLAPYLSVLASHCLWLNKYIAIDDKTIFSFSLSAPGINFVGQLFQNNQQIKKWDEVETEFDLFKNKKIFIAQITHALPSLWIKIRRNYTKSINNPIIQDHYLIKKHQIISLNKLNSATLYEILIDTNKINPTSQTYFSRFLILIGKATIYYLNNILYLNNMPFRFNKVDSYICSY